MHFSNKVLKKWVPVMYFILVVSTGISLFFFNIIKNDHDSNPILYILPSVFLLVILGLMYKNVRYFEYDSDGDVLNFINRGAFISNFINYRENKAEFPKRKLSHYKLNDYIIYKSLNVYVKTKNNRIKRLKFNVTCLGVKKVRALKRSLDKVVKNNKTALDGRQ